MSAPEKIGPPPKIPGSPPSLIDPLIGFARDRTKQRAKSATGRQSTILAAGLSPGLGLSSPLTTRTY